MSQLKKKMLTVLMIWFKDLKTTNFLGHKLAKNVSLAKYHNQLANQLLKSLNDD